MAKAEDCLEAVASKHLHSEVVQAILEEEDSSGAETLSQVVRLLEVCLAVHHHQDLGEDSEVELEELLVVGPTLVRVPWASMLEAIPAEEHLEVLGSAPRTTSLKTRHLHLAGTLVDSSVNLIPEACSETHHKPGLPASHSKAEPRQPASGTQPKACSVVPLEASELKIRIKLLVNSESSHNHNNSSRMVISFTRSSLKGLNWYHVTWDRSS